MTSHPEDPYLQWDAAYVLGSLPPSERHEFERHFADCTECSAAVADLAGLPGLLTAVDPREFVAAPDAAAPDAAGAAAGAKSTAATLAGLAARVRRHRRRILLATGALMVGLSAATAGTTLVAVAPPPTGQSQTIQAEGVKRLSFAGPSDVLRASGTLTPRPWGTQLDWTCDYTAPDGPSPDGTGYAAARYSMVIVDAGGHETTVADWTARPGLVVTPRATTSVPLASIRRVDVRLAAGGMTLLSAAP